LKYIPTKLNINEKVQEDSSMSMFGNYGSSTYNPSSNPFSTMNLDELQRVLPTDATNALCHGNG
jgi:hypothetical protein